MKLNELSDRPRAAKPRKRVGRGIGSGIGKTCGRGCKGQGSRSGVAIKGFEGGQMPLYRRLPKRGFKRPRPSRYATVNLGALQSAIDRERLDSGSDIDSGVLLASGLVRRVYGGVRLLGKGELKTKVHLVVSHASRSARDSVLRLGGSVTVLQEGEVGSSGKESTPE